MLTDSGIATDRRAVRFPGRSVSLPLDDATWTALQRCQEHRHLLGSGNPHLLVTRLLALTDELDANVLTTSLGMSYAGAAHYRPCAAL